ncbi:unnamed protein product [Vitrella brassicaformis CCMP3155]|uniref:Uncharacterized protein n=1 Tax=Vitrella brassicaformis (strain CCMP3155) TaxID=1169540 RepID=A0A0G4F610_VITBC|nr:unnamed protein product [Vitrella brassicaformis CCMP3155]|eukprot:CEM07663.1 unnamed protein product [Vitrella brassicaformis CCMP3155]
MPLFRRGHTFSGVNSRTTNRRMQDYSPADRAHSPLSPEPEPSHIKTASPSLDPILPPLHDALERELAEGNYVQRVEGGIDYQGLERNLQRLGELLHTPVDTSTSTAASTMLSFLPARAGSAIRPEGDHHAPSPIPRFSLTDVFARHDKMASYVRETMQRGNRFRCIADGDRTMKARASYGPDNLSPQSSDPSSAPQKSLEMTIDVQKPPHTMDLDAYLKAGEEESDGGEATGRLPGSHPQPLPRQSSLSSNSLTTLQPPCSKDTPAGSVSGKTATGDDSTRIGATDQEDDGDSDAERSNSSRAWDFPSTLDDDIDGEIQGVVAQAVDGVLATSAYFKEAAVEGTEEVPETLVFLVVISDGEGDPSSAHVEVYEASEAKGHHQMVRALSRGSKDSYSTMLEFDIDLAGEAISTAEAWLPSTTSASFGPRLTLPIGRTRECSEVTISPVPPPSPSLSPDAPPCPYPARRLLQLRIIKPPTTTQGLLRIVSTSVAVSIAEGPGRPTSTPTSRQKSFRTTVRLHMSEGPQESPSLDCCPTVFGLSFFPEGKAKDRRRWNDDGDESASSCAGADGMVDLPPVDCSCPCECGVGKGRRAEDGEDPEDVTPSPERSCSCLCGCKIKAMVAVLLIKLTALLDHLEDGVNEMLQACSLALAAEQVFDLDLAEMVEREERGEDVDAFLEGGEMKFKTAESPEERRTFVNTALVRNYVTAVWKILRGPPSAHQRLSDARAAAAAATPHAATTTAATSRLPVSSPSRSSGFSLSSGTSVMDVDPEWLSDMKDDLRRKSAQFERFVNRIRRCAVPGLDIENDPDFPHYRIVHLKAMYRKAFRLARLVKTTATPPAELPPLVF